MNEGLGQRFRMLSEVTLGALIVSWSIRFSSTLCRHWIYDCVFWIYGIELLFDI